MKSNVITYVTNDSIESLSSLTNNLNTKINQLGGIEEIFPLLSNPKFKTDLILLDLDTIKPVGSNIFDLISALNTLITCTVQRTGAGKPVKRNIPVAATVSMNTDADIIRDFINLKEVKYFFIKANDSTEEEFKAALTDTLEGKQHMPKRLQTKLNPKRKSKQEDSTNSIRLTPRQTQILHLVADRGASNKVIARTLDISESTVKLHMSAILKKFGVRNRTQLAIFSRNT